MQPRMPPQQTPPVNHSGQAVDHNCPECGSNPLRAATEFLHTSPYPRARVYSFCDLAPSTVDSWFQTLKFVAHVPCVCQLLHGHVLPLVFAFCTWMSVVSFYPPHSTHARPGSEIDMSNQSQAQTVRELVSSDAYALL